MGCCRRSACQFHVRLFVARGFQTSLLIWTLGLTGLFMHAQDSSSVQLEQFLHFLYNCEVFSPSGAGCRGCLKPEHP
jgi:hypothetical protein